MTTSHLDRVTPIMVLAPGARLGHDTATSDPLQNRVNALHEAGLNVPPIFVSSDTSSDQVWRSIAGMDSEPAGLILAHRPLGPAPTAVLAAIFAMAYSLGRHLLLVPHDALLPPRDAMQWAVTHALPAIEAGSVISIGLETNAVESEIDHLPHGHIRVGYPLVLGRDGGSRVAIADDFAIAGKPQGNGDADASAHSVWNSGLLLFHASALLDIFALHRPAYRMAMLSAFAHGRASGRTVEPDPDRLDEIADIALNEIILERDGGAAVVIAKNRRAHASARHKEFPPAASARAPSLPMIDWSASENARPPATTSGL